MTYDAFSPITNIGLAAPAVRALHGAGYKTLGDLTGVSEAELASLHGFGPNGQKKLNQALAEAGLRDPVDTQPNDPSQTDAGALRGGGAPS
ncbi:MAG TPA: DNA-directed RNA polymerase subunit alpha C-terminal domain-containing protein [Ktedonobacterales bacterium]